MTNEEVGVLLEEERTLVCATLGRDGWPHLMPLEFGETQRATWDHRKLSAGTY
jgi:hypothetical protein